jgi:tetratricopeptide (TPR) repeat protein
MLGIAMAASTAISTAALAEMQDYGSRAPSPSSDETKKSDVKENSQRGGATTMIGNRKVKLSAAFAKAYQEALDAVNANDVATGSAKVTAAHAAAKTPDEHYLAYQMQLKVALAAKNEADMGTALAGIIGTGVAPQEQQSTLHLALGKIRYNQKQYPQAVSEFEQVLKIEPGNTEASSLLADIRLDSASPADAVAMLRKSIAEKSAGGQKVPEELYKKALATAYKAKLPEVVDISRQWAAAYPTPGNWSDAINIYRNLHDVDDATALDLLRLARATGALKSEADYDRYAYVTLTTGYPGEANAVLGEGIKAGVVDVAKSPFKEEIAVAKSKSAGEEATHEGAASKALAGGTAKLALTTGDLLYGYGRYAKAAELYRAALKRPGVDSNLANLHLGMALALSGDKAGANAALNAVTGSKVEIAKYWLAYVSRSS